MIKIDYNESGKMSKKKESFGNLHRDLSDEDYKLELLFSQQLINDKLVQVRANLSKIVWVMAIIIILYILSEGFSLLSFRSGF